MDLAEEKINKNEKISGISNENYLETSFRKSIKPLKSH